MQYLTLQKLKKVIKHEPDMVKAYRVYEQYQTATAYETTFSYTAAYNNLDEMEGKYKEAGTKQP